MVVGDISDSDGVEMGGWMDVDEMRWMVDEVRENGRRREMEESVCQREGRSGV